MTRPPDADWAASLGAALTGAAAVAAIGTRAARLLDVAAAGTAHPGFGGPRFGTLTDCVRAAPGERTADAALLTLDALDADARAGASSDAGDGGMRVSVLDRALGTACRLYPMRLLLFVGADEAPSPETLFAFGFRRLSVRTDGALHEYRLHDYKTSPDWLNARYWANPERFALDTEDEDEDEDEDEVDEDEDEDEDEVDEDEDEDD